MIDVCLFGDCRESMRQMIAQGVKVQMCVTSPPYWGLRDYGTATWDGGETGCDHIAPLGGGYKKSTLQFYDNGFDADSMERILKERRQLYRDICRKCGARRIDSQLGLESTPEEYVAHMVEVFRLVRELLVDEATAWINLGDSYGPGKQLMGMPWKVAFALQDDGWILRSDIIWCLSGGAYVYARTQKGDMPMMIKDLVRLRPDTVKLWNGEKWTQALGWSRSPDPRDGALEIELRSGERIGCTPGHEWPTQRGNVRSDQLKVGDVIKTTRLPQPDAPKNPQALGNDVAWLCGLYLAEGSMSGDTVQIAGHALQSSERMARLEQVAHAFHGSVNAHIYGNTSNICLHGPMMARLIRCYIHGESAHDKGIKVRAWSRSDNWLRALLDGYLAGDGHFDADNDRWRLGFCRNDRLAADFRTLAARLGLSVRLAATTATGFGREWPTYRGDIRTNPTTHHNARKDGEVVAIGASRARCFWDIGVEDDPHLFALASGVLTHNSKPNPMPESVTDRPTKAHEYVFLLSKRERYYYDADAIREPHAAASLERYEYGFHATPANALKGSQRDRLQHGLGNSERLGDFMNSAGRNRRTVWTVATEPYAEAHFATFPTALIEPCILAGTSQQGHCPGCGKGWVRVVERSIHAPAYRPTAKPMRYMSASAAGQGTNGTGESTLAMVSESVTTGWQTSCACGLDPVPGIVFDPFLGSGTTAQVAQDLGRHLLGCELNPAYFNLQKKRTAQMGLVLA